MSKEAAVLDRDILIYDYRFERLCQEVESPSPGVSDLGALCQFHPGLKLTD